MNIAEEESWQNPPRRRKPWARRSRRGREGEKKSRTFFILAEIIRFPIVRSAVCAADADAIQ